MSSSQSGPRRYILHEANYKQLKDSRPNVAILPWGATEAHNYHLPHGTDVIEAVALSEAAAKIADGRGARIIVLPAIPYGNDGQQLDQVATIHFSTTTAAAILGDVHHSLLKQGIDRLVIVNFHGGNEFKPLVRDLQERNPSLIVVINLYQLVPELVKSIFANPGDHGGDLETSLLLHICPQWVQMAQAGDGTTIPFSLKSLKQPGVWTPRPWSKCQPDTGSGDPKTATAQKGAKLFEALSQIVADVLIELSAAKADQIP